MPASVGCIVASRSRVRSCVASGEDPGRGHGARLAFGAMAAEMRGRSSERALLERLLADARSGHSAVLVIRGEAGVGKTALLRHVAERASAFRVAHVAGVESEMELAYAGLHQLCA